MKVPSILALITATIAWPAVGQPAGGQTGGTSPATNPATPMQQQPSGTGPAGAAAAATGVRNNLRVHEGHPDIDIGPTS